MENIFDSDHGKDSREILVLNYFSPRYIWVYFRSSCVGKLILRYSQLERYYQADRLVLDCSTGYNYQSTQVHLLLLWSFVL
jgi:hypothetical protein